MFLTKRVSWLLGVSARQHHPRTLASLCRGNSQVLFGSTVVCHLVRVAGEMHCHSLAKFVPGTPAPVQFLAVGTDGGVNFAFAYRVPCFPSLTPFSFWVVKLFLVHWFNSLYINNRSPESHLATVFSPLCHFSLDFVVSGLCLIKQTSLVSMSPDFPDFS